MPIFWFSDEDLDAVSSGTTIVEDGVVVVGITGNDADGRITSVGAIVFMNGTGVMLTGCTTAVWVSSDGIGGVI